jgi:hypothetical protein
MRFARYVFLLLGMVVWAVGCSPTAIKYLYAWEVLPDDYRYGDLYRLTNLSAFREPRTTCGRFAPERRKERPKTHLYIIGDSFTEAQRIESANFDVDFYLNVHWSNVLHLKLDTTAHNILLLETVERHARDHFEFSQPQVVPDTATYVNTHHFTRFKDQLDNAFAANQAEDRLELFLFQYRPFLFLKEIKADLTYKWFGRVNERTTITPDGKHLLYYLDTDDKLTSSNFIPISDIQLDTIVARINRTTEQLYKLGFDRVGLSIIPNKTTLLYPEPQRYNRLIERIYAHPRLSVETIDVLPEYRNMGSSAYLRGDSHWTCEGQRVWLTKTNQWLTSLP